MRRDMSKTDFSLPMFMPNKTDKNSFKISSAVKWRSENIGAKRLKEQTATKMDVHLLKTVQDINNCSKELHQGCDAKENEDFFVVVLCQL